MNFVFTPTDWVIFGTYFLVLTFTTVLLSHTRIKSTCDNYVGENTVSMLAIARV